MKNAGRVSCFVCVCAAALALSGAAPGQSTKTVARAVAPAAAAPQPPDLAFKEVQVFYPSLNLGIRLVPAGGAAQTAVLRLVEDPSAPPGKKLGPDEASGQPGPIATRSCREPLRASMRVWVSNLGPGAFDATTDALGLSGTVAGKPVKSAFGKVAAGQTQYVEAGALSLSPGAQAAVLSLNTAHGGGETNFANNAFEARFQITCAGPAPTRTPTPATKSPAGVPTQAPTSTPAARNPLTGDPGRTPTPTPRPVAGVPTKPATPVPTPAGAAGGNPAGANAGARLAPAVVLAKQPTATPVPTATPRNLAGLGVASQVETCLRNGQPASFISTVNGKKGATFTPGGRYEIAGCGFGAPPGQLYLGAYVYGRGGFRIPLVVDSWGERKVTAHVDDAQNSNPDVGRVTVNLLPSGKADSDTIGSTDPLNRFETVKEVRWVRPPGGSVNFNPVWGVPSYGVDASGERTLVNRKLTVAGFCPNINETWPADAWNVTRLLDLGFKILEVDVVNLTDQFVGDNMVDQSVMAGGPGKGRFVAATKSVRVEWQGHSVYVKASVGVADDKYSVCTSSYALRLKVQGPKGVSPF